MDLTDAQWAVLEPHFRPKQRADGRGRPWRDTRAVLNAVLWVLRTGAPWHDLPNRYPPYQTCHRRFQQWRGDGTLTCILTVLAEDLRDRGKIDLSATFIDGQLNLRRPLLRIEFYRIKDTRSRPLHVLQTVNSGPRTFTRSWIHQQGALMQQKSALRVEFPRSSERWE